MQDTTENSTTLQIATQKGVDLNFSSIDLTLSLDDFSKRVLQPAMAVLAANIESDALSMYKDVYNQSNQSTITAALSFATVLGARKKLNDNLAPGDARKVILATQNNVDLVDALKGLFQDSSEIASQYREGMMGRTAGFDFYENTLLQRHTSGSDTGAGTSITISGANQTGASLTVTNSGSKTLKKGDIVTLAGVNRAHPETKADTGVLQQFVVTADAASTTVAISPSIILTGATQNVIAAPTDSGAVTKTGGASGIMDVSLAFHPDAFTFATADLVMPQGVDFSAREVQDGLSIRIVRQYDINNDKFPCRLDILYGYKTIRAQLASRIASNSSA